MDFIPQTKQTQGLSFTKQWNIVCRIEEDKIAIELEFIFIAIQCPE